MKERNQRPGCIRDFLRVIPYLLSAAFSVLSGSQSHAAERRMEERHLVSGSIRRDFLVHAPGDMSVRHSWPLILVLHGGGGTARGMSALTSNQFDQLADDGQALVVYPQGIRRAWNDGRSGPALSRRNGIDDVRFFDDLISDLQTRYTIDPARIYVAGISNGGMMALRLGCSLATKVRAVAAIAASLPEELLPYCSASSRVALLLIDGQSDPIVPYPGGDIRIFWSDRGAVLGAARTASVWAARQGCGGPTTAEALPDTVADETRITYIEYTPCTSGGHVGLYSIEGGGHTWPGGQAYLPERIIGKTSRDANAGSLIWNFFQKLPE